MICRIPLFIAAAATLAACTPASRPPVWGDEDRAGKPVVAPVAPPLDPGCTPATCKPGPPPPPPKKFGDV